MKIYHHSEQTRVTEITAGEIIISQGFWGNDDLSRSVVLILQHNERGSVGVLLNRQSNLMLNDVIPGINTEADLYYGGQSGINKIGFLHNIKELSRSIPIANNIYWGGNIYQLKAMFEHGETDPSQVHFYAGLMEWPHGMLEKEIEEKKWWIDTLTDEELLNTDSNYLWSLKLIASGNTYGMLYSVPDPNLN